jgi:ribonuclease BN (tRNA processing enzyme)
MIKREFGRGEGHAKILVGHTHWDHILGFPSFEPFYVEGNRFEIYSAGQGNASIQQILYGQQDGANFPVPFDGFRADFSFHRIMPGEMLEFGNTTVRAVQLNHQGITLGFRIETTGPGGAAMAIHTDTARISDVRLGDKMEDTAAYKKAYREKLCEHASGTDLLIHDSHFTEVEIKGKEFWGHSTPNDAVRAAIEAGTRRLALFHHAPEHSDDDVDEMVADAQQFADGRVEVFGAVERQTVHLGGDT